MSEESERVGFALRGDQGKVRFEVLGYEFPNPDGDPYSEWFEGVFSAEVGPWSGSFRGTMLAEDLRRLLEDFEKALWRPEFEVSFDPVEPHLVFKVEGRARGRGTAEGGTPDWVEVEGRLDHEPILGTELRFVLESDRKRLAETAKGIRQVLARFPNRSGKTPP